MHLIILIVIALFIFHAIDAFFGGIAEIFKADTTQYGVRIDGLMCYMSYKQKQAYLKSIRPKTVSNPNQLACALRYLATELNRNPWKDGTK